MEFAIKTADNSNDTNRTMTTPEMIVCKISEYFMSRIIIKIDERNNLCFKLFSESNVLKYHKIVSNKLYSFIAFGISFIM